MKAVAIASYSGAITIAVLTGVSTAISAPASRSEPCSDLECLVLDIGPLSAGPEAPEPFSAPSEPRRSATAGKASGSSDGFIPSAAAVTPLGSDPTFGLGERPSLFSGQSSSLSGSDGSSGLFDGTSTRSSDPSNQASGSSGSSASSGPSGSSGPTSGPLGSGDSPDRSSKSSHASGTGPSDRPKGPGGSPDSHGPSGKSSGKDGPDGGKSGSGKH
jgi:hypothetical protein